MANLGFTDAEVQKLRASFFLLIPVTDDLAEGFYARMFREHPEVRPLFRSDIESQQDKLIDTLAALLDTLERPAEAQQMLQELGHRHVGYGATPEMYDWVQTSLLEMVGPKLPPAEAAELAELWTRLMRSVCDQMLDGAGS